MQQHGIEFGKNRTQPCAYAFRGFWTRSAKRNLQLRN
jgi:hypothetical protein